MRLSFTIKAPTCLLKQVERVLMSSTILMKYSSQDGRINTPNSPGRARPSAEGYVYIRFLLCTKEPVSGITETGNDIAMFVKLFIHSSAIDGHIGMLAVQAFDALS